METGRKMRMADVLSALSMAVDLSMGHLQEFSIRCCYISQRLADKLGLSEGEKADIYYTSLLKDAG